MRNLNRWVVAAASVCLVAGGASAGPEATGLAGVSRTIAKAPAFATKTPGYCLAVFGGDAATRVWLVLDGDTLYADVNGNGDLTESGEKFAVAEAPEVEDGEMVKVTTSRFEIGDLPAKGETKPYQALQLMRYLVEKKPGAPAGMKGGDGYMLTLLLRETTSLKAGPNFGPTPAEAPVLHFDGPLQVGLPPTTGGECPILELGPDLQELTVQIGTPGIGTGSWTSVGYENVPESVKPVLEITFPAAKAGGPPIVQKFTLDERC